MIVVGCIATARGTMDLPLLRAAAVAVEAGERAAQLTRAGAKAAELRA